MENQFFITSCRPVDKGMKKHVVKNKVGLALRERISRAHRNGEEFYVMVMIPLMPAFEGDVLDTISAVLRIQIGYY